MLLYTNRMANFIFSPTIFGSKCNYCNLFSNWRWSCIKKMKTTFEYKYKKLNDNIDQINVLSSALMLESIDDFEEHIDICDSLKKLLHEHTTFVESLR